MHTSTAPTPTSTRSTPQPAPHRDVWMDAVRAAALLVVVLGHWLLAVVAPTPDGGLHVQSLLVAAPGSHWLTLAMQVMGAFFLVGGAVSVRSWRRARAAAEGAERGARDTGHGVYARWLGSRAAGLAGPVVPLLALWTALTPTLTSLGLPQDLAIAAGTAALAPLWFLVVYLLVQAAVPAVDAVVARTGWVRATAGLMACSAAVDLAARGHDVPLAGFGGFLVVWMVPVVLGIALADERLGAWAGWGLAATGAAGVGLLVIALDYPLLMVGTLPDGGSNQNPPSLALAFLVLCHVGLLVLTRARLTAWLRRPTAMRVTGLAAAWSMPVFLWHMSAMALAIGASLLHPAATFGLLDVAPLSATWWLVRPLWWLALLLWTAPLLLLAHRWAVLGTRGLPAAQSAAVTLAGVACAAAAIAVGSTWIGVPAIAATMVGLLVVAARLLGALPGTKMAEGVRATARRG